MLSPRLTTLRSLIERLSAGLSPPATPLPPPTEYLQTATAEDIFYCFRLLLGRCPHPEEWPGHSARVGEDLGNVVHSYVTSREFTERGRTREAYRDRVELVELPEFSIYAARDDLAVGRHVAVGRCYEPHIAAVLRRRARPGMAVIDIGANIGYLTMLLATAVGPEGLVVAVEPNPDNVRLLEASRRANGFGQIIVIAAAAGRETGILALNVSHSNGVTGGLPDDPGRLLAARPVPCLALDMVLPRGRPIDLVKLDVEGAELNALIGLGETLARDHPVIVSEFSPAALRGISHCSGVEYLRYLIARGYRLAVIDADGSERFFGDDLDGVMGAFRTSGIDHIDIVGIPS